MNSRTPEERERARLERERKRGNLPPDATTQPPQSRPADATVMGSQVPPPNNPPVPPPPPSWSGRTEERFAAANALADSPAGERPPVRPEAAEAPAKRLRTRLVVLIAVLVVAWLLLSTFQPFAGDGKGQGEVLVTVPEGASIGTIGELLDQKRVIDHKRFFGWRAKLSGRSDDFKAGRYRFAADMSYGAAIDRLVEGPNATTTTTTVTVIEGRSRYEVAQQLTESGVGGDYMAATTSTRRLNPVRYGAPRGTSNLEGFLFPATYELPAGGDAAALVAQQVTAFKDSFAAVSLRRARSKNLTAYDVLTIASLIEREVQVPSERRLVAAVIYNRLKAGIPLGIDATTRFETRNWTEPLTKAVLQKDSPFNTRTNKGLPPGPIGSPGLASIKAAANPASVGFLYYVANPCKPGAHAFSSTDAEFQADVARYEAARANAGGKQPSGC
ncbi:MAG: endolytic transglycosylase MltG [Solirubrobacterales bacterium]